MRILTDFLDKDPNDPPAGCQNGLRDSIRCLRASSGNRRRRWALWRVTSLSVRGCNWTPRGDLAPLLLWLWLGQWLHAGKNATMGMGRYRLRLEPR